jgi:hypothetical protein
VTVNAFDLTEGGIRYVARRRTEAAMRLTAELIAKLRCLDLAGHPAEDALKHAVPGDYVTADYLGRLVHWSAWHFEREFERAPDASVEDRLAALEAQVRALMLLSTGWDANGAPV